MRATAILLVTVLALSSPLSAQNAQPAPQGTAKKAKDPNRIICEKIEEIGSRLASSKVCMTAAEWDRQRQADKDLTDRLQQQTYKNQPG